MARHEGACEECSRNCELLHWNKRDLSPCVIRFFKVFIGKEILEAMILPPKFAHTVKDLVDQEIKLEDSSGLHWKVTLSCCQGRLAFHKGWKEFSCDHGLQAGDFLVFNYIKGSHFVVHIFDRTACEKLGSNKNISVARARAKGKTDSPDIPCQVTNANAINSDKNAPPVKRARTSVKTASQETRYRTTDMNAMNNNKNEASLKTRTRRNMAVQDTACGTRDNKARNEQSSGTSVPCLSNLKNNQIQPMTAIETPNSEGGNAKQLCMDDASCLIIERDAGYAQTEDRACLYDLSSFENQENKCFVVKNKKGTDGEEATPNHAERIVRSQSEANFVQENIIGTAALTMPIASKVGDVGTIENEKELGPTDNTPPMHEKVLSDGPSTGLPFSNSYVELADNCRKGDGLSNIGIPLQYAGSSNAILRNNGKSALPDEDTSLNCGGELPGPIFTVNAIQMVKQEQVVMEKQAYGCAHMLRKLEPSAPNECGSSSQDAGRVKVVKIEPVDSLDKSLTAASISCLAVTDGREFVELAERLPSVTFRKGRPEKKSLLLEDPEGRLWPALYHERSGFFLLISDWKKINEANGVQPGDLCVFSIEDETDGTFKMDVVRKQEDT